MRAIAGEVNRISPDSAAQFKDPSSFPVGKLRKTRYVWFDEVFSSFHFFEIL